MRFFTINSSGRFCHISSHFTFVLILSTNQRIILTFWRTVSNILRPGSMCDADISSFRSLRKIQTGVSQEKVDLDSNYFFYLFDFLDGYWEVVTHIWKDITRITAMIRCYLQENCNNDDSEKLWPLFRWFKLTLKPPYSITHGKLWLVIWNTSFWTFLVKFGHKGPWDIS